MATSESSFVCCCWEEEYVLPAAAAFWKRCLKFGGGSPTFPLTTSGHNLFSTSGTSFSRKVSLNCPCLSWILFHPEFHFGPLRNAFESTKNCLFWWILYLICAFLGEFCFLSFEVIFCPSPLSWFLRLCNCSLRATTQSCQMFTINKYTF